MIRKLLNDIKEHEPLLYKAGLVNTGLWFLFLALIFMDPREILGLNVWVKPSKFAISIAIYLFTIAAYMVYIPEGKKGRMKNFLRWGFVLTMAIEIILIAVQSLRGTTSHFNISTILDSTIFITMGVSIGTSSLLVLFLMSILIMRKVDTPVSVQIGMVMGIIIFMIGSYMGQLMVNNMAHTVGAPDGGPGLFYINWSTKAGDYRVAHFFGLHALQFMPILGYVFHNFSKKLKQNVPYGMIFMIFASMLYMFFVMTLYLQAKSGVPFYPN